MNTLENYEKNHLKELSEGREIPKFNPGDTLKVHLKIKEGEKERIQVFEGVCISRRNAGLNSSFTVRKISYGEGIERVLPLYSPQIDKIELVRSGDVRRSKLYYLRTRSGKSARIAEKTNVPSTQLKSEAKNQSKEKSADDKLSASKLKPEIESKENDDKQKTSELKKTDVNKKINIEKKEENTDTKEKKKNE